LRLVSGCQCPLTLTRIIGKIEGTWQPVIQNDQSHYGDDFDTVSFALITSSRPIVFTAESENVVNAVSHQSLVCHDRDIIDLVSVFGFVTTNYDAATCTFLEICAGNN